jgi:hypothetical protein
MLNEVLWAKPVDILSYRIGRLYVQYEFRYASYALEEIDAKDVIIIHIFAVFV